MKWKDFPCFSFDFHRILQTKMVFFCLMFLKLKSRCFCLRLNEIHCRKTDEVFRWIVFFLVCTLSGHNSCNALRHIKEKFFGMLKLLTVIYYIWLSWVLEYVANWPLGAMADNQNCFARKKGFVLLIRPCVWLFTEVM